MPACLAESRRHEENRGERAARANSAALAPALRGGDDGMPRVSRVHARDRVEQDRLARTRGQRPTA